MKMCVVMWKRAAWERYRLINVTDRHTDDVRQNAHETTPSSGDR